MKLKIALIAALVLALFVSFSSASGNYFWFTQVWMAHKKGKKKRNLNFCYFSFRNWIITILRTRRPGVKDTQWMTLIISLEAQSFVRSRRRKKTIFFFFFLILFSRNENQSSCPEKRIWTFSVSKRFKRWNGRNNSEQSISFSNTGLSFFFVILL